MMRLDTAIVAVIGLLVWGSWARADTAALREAKQLFTQGETAYRQGEFRAALSKYKQALALVRRPSIILNIAQCYRQLGDTKHALFFYRLYLSDWRRDRPGIDPPFEREVEKRIARLESDLKRQQQAAARARREREREQAALQARDTAQRLAATGTVPFEGVVPGATLYVDGVQRARSVSSWTTLELIAGAHSLRVEAPGHQPWVGQARVLPDKEVRVDVVLPELSTQRSTFWLVSGITTLALALGAEGAAIAFTVAANREFTGSSAFDRYSGLAIGGHVTAGVFAVTSAISWWLYARSGGSVPAQAVSVSLIPTASGLLATGALSF